MTGRRIGPYELGTLIGKGAMGEVYRARDTKLEREVAIKLLLADFAADAERLARFEREAKILAGLSHPNLVVVHGLFDAGGAPALAMELVEGESLARRLERERIPLEQCLEIARGIAEAVEAAHEEGIIHRDLKPGNILLSQQGAVKVVDFGLAKSLETPEKPIAAPAAAGGAAPAQTGAAARVPVNDTEFPGTQLGKALGTAGYMSPEQAEGRRVDKRTDVWSFGVVLYEMLSGRRLVGGQSLPEALGWYFHHEVDLDGLPRGTLEEIRTLLERCLERDPRQRLRDIGEARIELARALEQVRAASGDEVPASGAESRTGSAGGQITALAAGVALGWLLRGALGRRRSRERDNAGSTRRR